MSYRALLLLAGAAVACGDETPAKKNVGDPCSASADCREPLTCFAGLCRASCMVDSDCDQGYCDDSVCLPGERPLPVVSFATTGQTVAESAGMVSISLQLDVLAAESVTIPIAVAGGTATYLEDHSLAPGDTTIAAGQNHIAISFSVIDDDEYEGDETLVVVIGDPSGAVRGAITQHVVTITDDDSPPVPALTIGDATAAEGAQLVFTVQLSFVHDEDVSFDWTAISGTASAADFPTVSGTDTIIAGNAVTTLLVDTTQDVIDELDETLMVVLSNPVQATLGTASGTGTIVDDDDRPLLSISDVTVLEGDLLQLAIELDPASGLDVTVDWATTDGTAIAPDDYSAASGSASIPAGSTSALALLSTRYDEDNEPDETFYVTLSNQVNATLSVPVATVTIENLLVCPNNLLHVGTDQTYPTILEAYYAAEDGDDIIIHPGTHPAGAFNAGSGGVKVTKDVRFWGATGNPDDVILTASLGQDWFEFRMHLMVSAQATPGMYHMTLQSNAYPGAAYISVLGKDAPTDGVLTLENVKLATDDDMQYAYVFRFARATPTFVVENVDVLSGSVPPDVIFLCDQLAATLFLNSLRCSSYPPLFHQAENVTVVTNVVGSDGDLYGTSTYDRANATWPCGYTPP